MWKAWARLHLCLYTCACHVCMLWRRHPDACHQHSFLLPGPLFWLPLLRSVVVWRHWNWFIFNFSLIEHGMAGAMLANIPERKTGGCLGYGNSKETSNRLGFCFSGISFLQGQVPGRAALLSSNLICITPQCCRLSRFSLQATSVIPVL